MAYMHFFTCMALTFAPYIVIYNYSALSEYSAWRQALKTVCCYALTQFVKLALYATAFSSPSTFNVHHYFLTNSADFFDLIGLLAAFNWITGRSEVRILMTGFGWSLGHSIFYHIVPLYIGARAPAFHWQYIQRGIEANIDLPFYIGLALFVWLSQRCDKATAKQLVLFFLAVGSVRTAIFEILEKHLSVVSWSLLGFKALYSLTYSGAALAAYSNYGQTLPPKSN